MVKLLKKLCFLFVILFLTLAMLPQANLLLAEDSQIDQAAVADTVSTVPTKTIRLLETSDIHGQIDNWNYFTDAAYTGSSACGMTRIASYANQVRTANPNTLLIDNGDTTQGTPVNALYNILNPSVPNPISVAMNYMGYTSMTLGNHEFNFGLGVLNKIGGEMAFPELSANIRKTSDNSNAFTPYLIKDVDGVKVGILGLSPQAIPHWEKPENITGLKFTDPIVEANHFVPLMKAAGASVIVIAAHSGWDPTFGYGPEENFLQGLANQVPGVDVIMGGHDHTSRNTTLNNVLITVPKNGATQVCDISVTVTSSGPSWYVTTKTATIALMSTIAENPGLVALMQPYHDATRAYINQVIGSTTGPFPGGAIARFKDGPTADLINLVQTEAAAAAGFPVDASCAALFNDAAALPAGSIKLKDAFALYIYDNTLYVVQCTGAAVKSILEWTVGYFANYSFAPGGPSYTSGFPAYNYDMWSGIDYKIDITKPVGSRIVELKLHGVPITATQTLRVAANNYRATGKFLPAGATVLYQSTDAVRDLVTNYIQTHSPLDPNAIYVHNWDIVPNPDLWLNPNTVMSRTDYLNLVKFAFGKPSLGSYLFADPLKGTALLVDLDNRLFQYFDRDKSYGIFKIPALTYPRPGFVQFAYRSTSLIVSATLNLSGNPLPSIVDIYDLFNRPGFPAPNRLISYDNSFTFNTERALTFLVNLGMKGIVSPLVDWTSLQSYPDWRSISPWSSSAYTFMVKNLVWDHLNPAAPVTNASALSWVQEAKYPLLSFISTSDFHGQLDPITVSGVQMGSAAVDTTYIKNYRALNPLGSLLVDSGDIMQGTLISNYFKGASTISVFNTMGYQASALGNHDFDWGQPIQQQRIAQANFPWLCCNVFLAGTNNRPVGVNPSTILQAKGLKIGLIGAITMETPSIVMPSSIAGLEFRPAAPIINQIAADLRAAGANVIVVLAHIGGAQNSSGVITGEVATLANNLVGVNYIASGHSHVKLNSVVNGIPITQPYSSGSALGLANIRIDRSTGQTFNYDLQVNNTPIAGVTPDPTIAAMVAGYNATIAVIKNQWIGTISSAILRDNPPGGTRYNTESSVGDLCTDAQAWKGGVSICFTNPGGIRANIQSPTSTYPYNVTWNDLYTVQPFDNLVTLMDLTGAQIKAILEQGVAPVKASWKLLQVSGIKYTVQESNAAGSKVIALTLADNTPINPTSTYRIACNNFLATGGDGFTVFTQGINQYNTGISDITALVDYILFKYGTPPSNTTFTYAPEGRITVVP